MGLLDKVLHMGASSAPAESQSSLVSVVLSMLEGGGGIQGLAEKFNANGLGNVVQSWISTGRNLPVSPEQVTNVLGSDKINEVAGRAGISPEQASTGLSQVLPEIVNRLTPNGEVPTGSLLSKGADLLKQRVAS